MFCGRSGFNAELTDSWCWLCMNTETVTLKLPRTLLSRASIVAEKQDVTVGHLVRKLLSKEVERQLKAYPSNRAD